MGFGERKVVLVAEDDAAQREILQEVLSEEGYDVQLADSPPELLERLTARPDAVLMDLVGVASPQVMRALEALYGRSRVLLISGDSALPETAARLRADAFIRKPYELSELLHCLKKLVTDQAPF